MARNKGIVAEIVGVCIAVCIYIPFFANAADPVSPRPTPPDPTEQDLALLRTLGMPQGVLLRVASPNSIPAPLRGNFPSIPAGSLIVFFDNSYSSGYLVVGNSWIYFNNSRPESNYAAALATANVLPTVDRAIRSLGIPVPQERTQIRPSVSPFISPLQEQGGFIHAQPGLPQTPNTIFFSARPDSISWLLGHERTHQAGGHDPGDSGMLARCRLASFPLCELMPAVAERVLGFDHVVTGELIGLSLSLDFARDARGNPIDPKKQFGDWLREYLTSREHEYTPYTYAFTPFLIDEMYARLLRGDPAAFPPIPPLPRNQIPAEIQRRLTAAAGATDAAGVAVALGFRGNRWRDPFAVMSDALFAQLETWRTSPDPRYEDFQDQLRMVSEQIQVRAAPLSFDPGQSFGLRPIEPGDSTNPLRPGLTDTSSFITPLPDPESALGFMRPIPDTYRAPTPNPESLLAPAYPVIRPPTPSTPRTTPRISPPRPRRLPR